MLDIILAQVLHYIPQTSGLVAFTMFLYVANRSSHSFNVFDYLIDKETGKASIMQTGKLLATIISAWIMWKLTVTDKMTIDYFLGYLGVFVAADGWNKFVSAKYDRVK